MDRGSQEGLGFSAEAGSPQRVLYSRTCSDSLSEGPHTVGHEWTQAPGSCLEPVLAGGQSGEVAARHPAAEGARHLPTPLGPWPGSFPAGCAHRAPTACGGESWPRGAHCRCPPPGTSHLRCGPIIQVRTRRRERQGPGAWCWCSPGVPG